MIEPVAEVNSCKYMTRALRTLLIDNYDSYTFNIYQLLATVNQGGKLDRATVFNSRLELELTRLHTAVPPTVVKNDVWSWSHLQNEILSRKYDNIVISPGPGTPECSKDIGRQPV